MRVELYLAEIMLWGFMAAVGLFGAGVLAGRRLRGREGEGAGEGERREP